MTDPKPPHIGRVSDRVAWFHDGAQVSPAFNNPALAEKWMERHADEFVLVD